MLMAACDPNDDQFPTPSDEYINDVYQTSWVYEERDTYEDENGVMQESVETGIIAFKSKETLTLYGSEGYSLNFTPLRTAK